VLLTSTLALVGLSNGITTGSIHAWNVRGLATRLLRGRG